MAVDNTARWMRHAACATRPDLPWITDTALSTRAQVRAMTRVCAGCPVRNHCAAYATETGITGGFWASRDRDVFAAQRLDATGRSYQPPLPGLPPPRGAA